MVDSYEDGNEDQTDTSRTRDGNRMLKYHAWEEDRQALPNGHDDCERDGAEFGDRVEDEELSNGRRSGQDENVTTEERVAPDKCKGFHEHTLLEQWNARQQDGEEIHSGHHLERWHFVRLEKFTLPVRSEGIED